MTREKLPRSPTAPQRQVTRAKALLMAVQGVTNEHLAASVAVSPTTARARRARFAEEGLARLGQARKGPRPKPSIKATATAVQARRWPVRPVVRRRAD